MPELRRVMVLYDDGHWKITECPDDPLYYMHVYVAHTKTPFPECWSVEALASFHVAIVEAMAEATNEW